MPQRRPLLIPGLAAVLALTLSGCFGGSTAEDRREGAEGIIDSTAAPAETEVDGDLLRTVEFDHGLQVDVYLLGHGMSAKDSAGAEGLTGPRFAAGSPEVGVAYVLSNPTDEPIDVSRFRQNGAFEGADSFAWNDSDGKTATHLQLGYASVPAEQFGSEDGPWLLEPGETTYYADTIYLEGSEGYIATLELGSGERVDRFEIDLSMT